MKLYKKLAYKCWNDGGKGLWKRMKRRILRRQLNELYKKEVDELER